MSDVLDAIQELPSLQQKTDEVANDRGRRPATNEPPPDLPVQQDGLPLFPRAFPVPRQKDSASGPLPPRVGFICLFIHTGDGKASKEYRVNVPQHMSDESMFTRFRWVYNNRLRSFWQRFFCLRGLKYTGLLEYSGPGFPTVHPFYHTNRFC